MRPAAFGFNSETAATNSFQNLVEETASVGATAAREFDTFAEGLRSAGIEVVVFKDTATPGKPDAVFPNNWISLHADGTMVLYPMCAPNRRLERREDILVEIKTRFGVARVIDLSPYEKEGRFLEGTGSIVFDHKNKVAYACLSPRTDEGLLGLLCKEIGYEPVCFTALDVGGKEIYHTNVMMCVGDGFAVLCAESIPANQRASVLNKLTAGTNEIIEITREQMNSFAGNLLALKNKREEKLLIMSQSAFKSLNAGQIARLEKHARLLPLAIPTIERIGGGSARCMIAEIFLAPR